MRTLKKSLALVLALVMVLGLAVVGASADNAIDKFEDSDQIGDAYLEAVGVLTGLAIVDGMTDTEIAPQGTYQRDQAAKIIAYMVLGKEAADSLVASYAPFQDVPADYWAAGYIAFCKEQGIIDGVSDTSFDPYGTLTGFQWAKMLLAAVGFNANNELEGDSWSLNTARTGHEVGLFDGDNAGADHVALRREQAMLYAFNTLTNVRQVTYTGNGNNYVYDIYGYEWADGTGYTLGAEVFDLSSVEGQIVDNEATGANATYIANIAYDPNAWWWEESFGEDDVVGIKANTGLDLMYHAVRAWYTGSNTNVYVYDLAEVTTYDCLELVEDGVAEDAIADLDLSSTQLDREYIGADTRWTVPYEGYLIDNTALSELTDYSYVTVYAGIGDLTYRNTATEQTTIDGELVDNDDIKTDISDIAYGDTVVYIHAYVTADAVYDDVKPADGEGWHVYPVTTTEGVVESIDRENGVITVNLTDDTTLNVSALSELVFSGVLTEEIILGRNYSFVLDTHGDVIDLNRSRDLYAFTGAVRHTDDWNSYSKEVVGQFVKVGTTEVEEFSVIMDNGTYRGLERGQYYDISAMTNSDGEYVATLVEEDDNVYADSYVIDYTNANAGVVFSGSIDEYHITGYDVTIDPEDVTFIIASGRGDDLELTTYTGVAELLRAFGVSSRTSVALQDPAFVVSYNGTGNDYTATTVFAFTDDMLVQSNYVFVPYDVQFSSWDHVTGGPDGYYTSYDGDAYIDGAEVTMDIEVNDTLVGTDLVLKRGFYTYTITDGVVSLENRVTTDNEACFYLENYDVKVERTATGWEINDVDVVKEPTIVDCRNTDYTTIETMQQLYEGYELNWPGYTGADLKLTIGYTLNGDGDVQYIYVVDSAWHNELTVELGSNMGTGYWNVSNVIWQDHVNGDDISFDMIWLQTNDRTDEVVAFNYTLSYVDEDGVPQTVTDTVFGTFNGKVCPITIEAVDIDWDQDAVLTINEAEFAEAMTLELSDDVSGKDMADYYAAPSTEPIYGVVGETISIDVVYTAHDVVVDTNDTITVNGTACTITNVEPVGNTQVITFSYEVVDNVTTLTIGGINVNA